MPTITGFHHIALTVTDVERSAAWYRDLLGMVDVFGGDDEAVRFRVLAHPGSGGLVGLRQYAAGSGSDVHHSAGECRSVHRARYRFLPADRAGVACDRVEDARCDVGADEDIAIADRE